MKKGKQDKTLVVCATMVFALILVCVCGAYLIQKNQKPQIKINLEQVESPCVILMDAQSGNVISERESDMYIYPASMVKMMTVYTAIQLIPDLEQKVVMHHDYFNMLYDRDASRAGFEPGEEVVVKDLLYGAMLPSGAECCMELALTACGSEADFVLKMNDQAKKMGLTRTHFANTSGLQDEDQYSTVKEMAMILKQGMKNQTFADVFTSKEYTMHASAQHPEGFTVRSSMFKSLNEREPQKGMFLGGKTGYTDEAGHCLASLAKIQNHQYILVTAGWPDDQPKVEQYHISDALNIYDQIAP